jgi:hypothetical protein
MESKVETTQLGSTSVQNMSPETQLRVLLADEKPDEDLWQEITGRLVSLIHLKTLKVEASDADFLESICLIIKAQLMGCKVAKKKAFNLARFKDRAPFEFTIPADVEEQKVLFNLLSKIQTDWCIDFVTTHVTSSALDKSVVPILIKWSAKCSGSASTLWKSTLHPLLASQIDEKIILIAIKDFEKCAIDFIKPLNSDRSLSDFSSLLPTLADDLSTWSGNKKISSLLISAVVVYINALRDSIPVSIIDNIFIASISDFSKSISTLECAKEWEQYCLKLSASAASILNSLTKSLGPTSADFWSNHLANLSIAYPTIFENLKAYTSENILIPYLLGNKSDGVTSLNSQYESEANITTLLQTWQNFRNQHSDLVEAETLELLITSVAKSLGVEYFGKVGSTSAFDPIEHTLLEQATSMSNVTILQQGIQLTRADGSIKILHPAIVK